jgi:hypothetical protein
MPRAGTRSCWPARRPHSFHRAGWQRMVGEVFGTTPIFCTPSRAAPSLACCRWPTSTAGCSAMRWSACRLPSTVASPPVDEAQPPRCWRQRPRPSPAPRRRPSGAAQCRTPRHADWPTQDLYVTFRKPDRAGGGGQHAGHPAQAARDGAQGHQERPGQPHRHHVDRFFALYADNVHRHGTPAMPKRYFKALMQEFGAGLRSAHRPPMPAGARSAA